MGELKVLLALTTEDNDYQREQASVAQATADRLGISLQVVYAGNEAIGQTKQILGIVHDESERPHTVIVEPVGTGMLPVATTAVKNGVGWIVLNRESDYLAPLREESSPPIGSVVTDNVEIGRIQGRQFAALLPDGGAVLYIEGPATDVSKQRRAGLGETLPANIQIESARGNWTEESGSQVLKTRLRFYGDSPANVGIVGCMNDAMAMGARRVVEALEDPEVRGQWLKIPFTGVDGVPSTGKVWVENRLLAATVIQPVMAGVALELVAEAVDAGTQVPETTVLSPESYPALEELGATA
ncbi:MAG: substrate-binding domain-containing protein [Gemmatimonadota bacterium]|nr:MAG: substrate-binding domain-containing protein [Gemmatimonadota bacterium]